MDMVEESVDMAHAIQRKKASREWMEYVQLQQDRPEEFHQSSALEIVTDIHLVCTYEMELGRTFGVVYHSPFSLLVVDLVKDPVGRCFAYERLLPAVARDPAVVCVCTWEGRYALLRQFRHALRGEQLAFPRGYGEEGIPGPKNAAKEAQEELGVGVSDVKYLGEVIADSGISGNKVQVYLCELKEAPVVKSDYEGIQGLVMVTADELNRLVREGEINDGFTLSAMKLAGV